MEELDHLISEIKNEITNAYDTAFTKQQFEQLHGELKAKEEKLHKTIHHVYNTKEALRQELRKHEDNEASLHQTIALLTVQKNDLEAQILNFQGQVNRIRDEKTKINSMAGDIKTMLSDLQLQLKNL